MTYQDAIDFLFNSFPVFQNKGAGAYKPGLDTTRALSRAFGDPHRCFKSIHVGGTNGKGSTAHTLAAILQSAGYRVGLFTSPHLVDFRERIRVDGEMIPEEEVIGFVRRYRSIATGMSPSFFELTTIMAFDYFAKKHVDVAVVEVGLGGCLDSTNIIMPELSVITNISYDHTALLGNTLEAIAGEKAGIIKPGVPVVVGESQGGVREVFRHRAEETGSPVVYADDRPLEFSIATDGMMVYESTPFGKVTGELSGDCQPKNAATVMAAVLCMRDRGWDIPDSAVADGFACVISLTGLKGRWMTLAESPRVICDTGHNEGGWRYIASRLGRIAGVKHLVIGFVSDKDVSAILGLISGIRDKRLYFTSPSVERGMDVNELASRASDMGLRGECFSNVDDALVAAMEASSKDDTVFVGGSTFVVADLLKNCVL